MIEHKQTKVLYQQKQYPVFQNRLYGTEAEAKACPRGDIRLVEDLQTGLVYNADFCADLMSYDNCYQNEQAYSPLFQEHLLLVSEIVRRCLGWNDLVEIGCGKGFFLEMLIAKGVDIRGYDPTYEGDNPRVHRNYFMPDVARRAKGLILRHVLEHIQNPVDFLLHLKQVNGGSGKIYIEVPCFDWICQRRTWFDIFYEHVNYFRLSDFERMFEEIIDCGRLFGGQYLYVVAELSKLKMPEINLKDQVTFPVNFVRTFSLPGAAAIWGSASKGVIFALLQERAGHPVGMAIDINPMKQGKYLPATGLLVKSPAEALVELPKGATIFVMNTNYFGEIREMSDNKYNYIEVDNG